MIRPEDCCQADCGNPQCQNSGPRNTRCPHGEDGRCNRCEFEARVAAINRADARLREFEAQEPR